MDRGWVAIKKIFLRNNGWKIPKFAKNYKPTDPSSSWNPPKKEAQKENIRYIIKTLEINNKNATREAIEHHVQSIEKKKITVTLFKAKLTRPVRCPSLVLFVLWSNIFQGGLCWVQDDSLDICKYNSLWRVKKGKDSFLGSQNRHLPILYLCTQNITDCSSYIALWQHCLIHWKSDKKGLSEGSS